MSKIKVIIVDDEKLARDIIKNYLKDKTDYKLIAECQNGFEGIKTINEHKPDLVFLDIQMPKISGFEMLELLEDKPKIIFTTAFDQYAIKAFEVNAIDYLLKPFTKERFDEALQKAVTGLRDNNKIEADTKKLLGQPHSQGEYLNRVVVKKNNNIIIVPIEDVKFIEAQDDYTAIHTSDSTFLKQQTMKFFEENLDSAEFVRIHRSHITKISQIKQLELYEKESYRVILKDGTKLPVSKTGYAKLKEVLK